MLTSANTSVAPSDVYTDFSGLAKLKNEAREQSPESIKEVAQQFESIFIGMVLKSMRAAKLTEGGLMDNDQSKMFQEMYDQQLSVELAGKPGIGLADVIAKQLSPQENVVADVLSLADYRARPVRSPFIGKKLPQLENINSKEEFVGQLQGFAKKAAKELGIDAQVLLAQAALETGWGQHVMKTADGQNSFNLFNIKAHSKWDGKKAVINTLEFHNGVPRQEKASFRAYDGYDESFQDYVQFIKQSPRYQKALQQGTNAERYMHELQTAGYATDPAYTDKVMRVYHNKELAEMNTSTISLMNKRSQ